MYRIGGPISSKSAIYNDDRSIGRLEVKSVTPPHTAGSLRQNLHKIESTPSSTSRLLISLWSQEFCDDSYRLDLSGETYPGSSEHEPVVLFLDLAGRMSWKVLDEQMMQVSGTPPKVAFGIDPQYIFAYNLTEPHSLLSPILRRWRVRVKTVLR